MASGGLVGMVTAMALIGWLVPIQHAVTLTLALPVPAATLWRTITDLAGQPVWRKSLDTVARQPDEAGTEVWLEQHGRHAIRFRTPESTSPRHLVRRIVEEHGPFRGEWDYGVEPLGATNGSRITLTERGEVPNPIFRFVNRFLIGQASSVQSYLTDLARRFDAPPLITTPRTVGDDADGH